MASLTSSRAFTSARASAPSRRSVRVCCQKQGGASVQRAALAAAAAAMLTAFPVNAKVILEQPQLRKVLQDDGTPAAPAPKKEIRLPGTKAAAPAKAAPAAKAEESSVGGEFDPKSAALPLALVSLAGGAVALTKLDDGFADFMDTAGAKNSNDLGAGYEVALKEGGVAALAKKTPAASKRASPTGTKRVKAANKSLGGLGGLGNLFGSKDE